MSHELWREHLRIAILRLLESQPGYVSNDSVLTDALRGLGFGCSRDQVRSELAWLTEQGLTQAQVIGGLKVATLTQRGQDVAVGAASVPGVRRPSPRG